MISGLTSRASGTVLHARDPRQTLEYQRCPANAGQPRIQQRDNLSSSKRQFGQNIVRQSERITREMTLRDDDRDAGGIREHAEECEVFRILPDTVRGCASRCDIAKDTFTRVAIVRRSK